jgi:hypothetical protein
MGEGRKNDVFVELFRYGVNSSFEGCCFGSGLAVGLNGDPRPAFATTSKETIDFSIGFGFAALIYVSLEILREFSVDVVDFCRENIVFTRRGRVEDRGERPGEVASERTGLLEQTARDG